MILGQANEAPAEAGFDMIPSCLCRQIFALWISLIRMKPMRRLSVMNLRRNGNWLHFCLQARLLPVFHNVPYTFHYISMIFHVFPCAFDFDCRLVMTKQLKYVEIGFCRNSDMGLVNDVNDVNVGRPTWMRLWMRCWWGDWLNGGCRWIPKCGSENYTVDTSSMISMVAGFSFCRFCAPAAESSRFVWDMCWAWYTGTYTKCSYYNIIL